MDSRGEISDSPSFPPSLSDSSRKAAQLDTVEQRMTQGAASVEGGVVVVEVRKESPVLSADMTDIDFSLW